VAAQILSTKGDIGYLIVDLDAQTKLSVVVKEKLDMLEASIKSRVIWKAGMYSTQGTPEPDMGALAEQLELNERGTIPKAQSSDRLQTISEVEATAARKVSEEEIMTIAV